MNGSLAEEILSSSETSFISSSHESRADLRPKLVFNDIRRGEIVLSEIVDNLRSCRSFSFSIAFITLDGLEMLLQALRDAGPDVRGRRMRLPSTFRAY